MKGRHICTLYIWYLIMLGTSQVGNAGRRRTFMACLQKYRYSLCLLLLLLSFFHLLQASNQHCTWTVHGSNITTDLHPSYYLHEEITKLNACPDNSYLTQRAAEKSEELPNKSLQKQFSSHYMHVETGGWSEWKRSDYVNKNYFKRDRIIIYMVWKQQ